MKVLPARPLLAGGQCPPQRHQESYSLVAEAVGRYYPYSQDEDGVRLSFRPSDNAAGYTPEKKKLPLDVIDLFYLHDMHAAATTLQQLLHYGSIDLDDDDIVHADPHKAQ